MKKLEIEIYLAYLISNKINYVEKIKEVSKMQMATLLTIKSNSLIGCYILDGNNKLYKIIEVIIIGEIAKKKWFDFTFGNPTKKN